MVWVCMCVWENQGGNSAVTVVHNNYDKVLQLEGGELNSGELKGGFDSAYGAMEVPNNV